MRDILKDMRKQLDEVESDVVELKKMSDVKKEREDMMKDKVNEMNSH